MKPATTLRVTSALAMLGLAAVAHAQSRIAAAPATAAPVAAPGVATFGTPSPNGLASRFPAGLQSPLPSPAGLPSPTVPNVSAPGTAAAGSPVLDAGVAPATNVLGGVAAGGIGLPRLASGAGSYGWSAVDIARSFILADANRDGELTRSEAMRLAIVPYSFEEMDRNRDGVITRFEYEDAVR